MNATTQWAPRRSKMVMMRALAQPMVSLLVVGRWDCLPGWWSFVIFKGRMRFGSWKSEIEMVVHRCVGWSTGRRGLRSSRKP